MSDNLINQNINITIVYIDESGSLYNEEIIMSKGSTIKDALYTSKHILNIKDIDYLSDNTGVFGKLKKIDSELYDNDRVEVYRKLLCDPRDSRLRRLTKQKSKKLL
ncbi:MAG: RnfH family protein [Candidatus Kinetoplastibacterium crithidii]|nr:MAG: RnfH family protein [Candidatus Kinetoplastibacterium crithidii]